MFGTDNLYEDLVVAARDNQVQLALFFTFFNPVFWNVMAQLEYRTKLLSRVFRGKHVACCFLAVSIILLNCYRDFLYHEAIGTQSKFVFTHCPVNWQQAGLALGAVGQVMVWGAFFRLGWFGTFLGDYFGIFKLPGPVTSFPFNVLDNPMYWGSTLSALGGAFYYQSPLGLALTVVRALMYKLAICFEGRMLRVLYSRRAKELEAEKKEE